MRWLGAVGRRIMKVCGCEGEATLLPSWQQIMRLNSAIAAEGASTDRHGSRGIPSSSRYRSDVLFTVIREVLTNTVRVQEAQEVHGSQVPEGRWSHG